MFLLYQNGDNMKIYLQRRDCLKSELLAWQIIRILASMLICNTKYAIKLIFTSISECYFLGRNCITCSYTNTNPTVETHNTK